MKTPDANPDSPDLKTDDARPKAKGAKPKKSPEKQALLAARLRENLTKRKSQSRARAK
ncbi:MAG: hypothetical protein AB8B77_01610 [Alphaproteobacteria bacterium]